MNQFKTVFSFNLKESFNSKSFKITAIILFSLILGFFGITHFISDENKEDIRVLSTSTNYQITNESFGAENDFMELKTIKKEELENVKTEVKEGETDGLVIIGEANGIPTIEYYYSQFPDHQAIAAIQNLLQSQYTNHIIKEKNVDPEVSKALLSSVEVKTENLNSSNAVGLVYFFSILMYIFIIMFGQMVALSISGEKVSRVMEVMITKVKPITMMYAKVLSTMLTGLSQIAIVAAGYLAAKLLGWAGDDGLTLMGMPIDLSVITVEMFILFAVYFILGFCLYAILFAALSSVISRIEDLNSVITPVMLLLVAAFYIAIKCMTDPSSTLVVISSYIPFFSPVVTFSRMIMGETTYLEIGITIAALVATIALLGHFATRVYASGVMRYSEKTKFSDVLKMTKEK